MGQLNGIRWEESRTIENWALEETNELEEEILLLSSQLVPSRLSSASLDISAAETSLHVGGEPVIWSLETGSRSLSLLLATEEALLLWLLHAGARGGGASTPVAVGRDVTDKVAVLSHILVVVGDGVATNVLLGIAVTDVV